MTASRGWLEVAIPAPSSFVDELAALIAGDVDAAAAGLEVRADEVAFWTREGSAGPALDECRALLAALAARGAPVDPDGVEVRAAPAEDEWREAYKRYFRPTRLTRQIVVVPSWEAYDSRADDHVIDLDPGQAFGTGAHATTRLVLGAIQDLADSGEAVHRALDFGTGSGILAIAVARLFPSASVAALDLDPLAVAAAAENSERNRCGGRVRCSAAPIEDLDGPFDLVLANIRRHVLLDRAAEIGRVSANPGWAVLSGLLEPELDEVAAAFVDHGWAVVSRSQAAGSGPADGDSWGALVLRREAR